MVNQTFDFFLEKLALVLKKIIVFGIELNF